MKKILFIFTMVVIGFIAVACNGSDTPIDTRVTLLDLVDKTEQEIEALYDLLDINITFVYATSTTVEEGKFIRYRGGYQVGERVNAGTAITIEIAIAPETIIETFELLDMTGRTQAQIVVLYQGYDVVLNFVTVETNAVAQGRFVAYDGYQIGDEVPFGSTITVQIAVPIVVVETKVTLIDLTGMTQQDIEEAYEGQDIELNFIYQNSSTIPGGQFVSYLSYTIGTEVAEGTAVTVRLATPGPTIVGAEYTEVFVSVTGNPPTFDLSEGVQAFDYLGNEIIFGGGFFFVSKVEDANGQTLPDVDYYRLGEYTVYYTAINALKTIIVERTIKIIIPPFDTNHTDALRLTQAYQGLSFINDGIGEVTVSSFVDGDTTIFRDHRAGLTFTVRYLGMDTPEATSRFDPWGSRAGNFVREKLSEAERIVLQAEPGANRQDGNGRWLAWVWYFVDGESRLINLELVEQAYAWISGASQTQYGNIFTVAAAETQLTGRRIYGEIDPDFDYSSDGTPVDIEYLLNNFDDYLSRKVIVAGIITAKVGNSIYLEDDGFAIFLYTGYSLTNELQIGHEIVIQGLVATVFNGAPQLSNYKIENMVVLSTDNEITITTIMGNEMPNYMARVVRLENLTITSIFQSSVNIGYNVYARDANNVEVNIRVDAYTASFVSVSLFQVGGTIHWVFGPVSQFNGVYQLLLPGMGNISLG